MEIKVYLFVRTHNNKLFYFYNDSQNIWDFRKNPWNFETWSDLLSSIKSLRMEEIQRASFNIDLRLAWDFCILALKGLKCSFKLRDIA